MAWGSQTGCYLSPEQVTEIQEIIRQNPNNYTSRNAFIRGAIQWRIRLEHYLIQFDEPERETQRRHIMSWEQNNGKSKTRKAEYEESNSTNSV